MVLRRVTSNFDVTLVITRTKQPLQEGHNLKIKSE